MKRFVKRLSANDVGTTGGHMGGILVPKGNGELLGFLPPLEASTLNPSTLIDCETPDGTSIRLRFVYYNNRLHKAGGTRNEYRITHLTKFLRDEGAREGDLFEIAKEDGQAVYLIRVSRRVPEFKSPDESDGPLRVKLTMGWRRMH